MKEGLLRVGWLAAGRSCTGKDVVAATLAPAPAAEYSDCGIIWLRSDIVFKVEKKRAAARLRNKFGNASCTRPLNVQEP